MDFGGSTYIQSITELIHFGLSMWEDKCGECCSLARKLCSHKKSNYEYNEEPRNKLLYIWTNDF